MATTYHMNNNNLAQVIAGIDMDKEFTVAVSGTFSNATVQVQYAVNSTYSTFQSFPTGNFTSAAERVFINVGDLNQVKLLMTGNETATDVKAIVGERRSG